jgi:hypothetical protein
MYRLRMISRAGCAPRWAMLAAAVQARACSRAVCKTVGLSQGSYGGLDAI